MQKIKKEPKVSASSVNVSPGIQLDEALTNMNALIDAKANTSDVAAVTGNRSSLNTTDKSNLVAAVNETLANIITDYDDLSDKPIVKTENNGFKIVAHGSRNNNTASAQNAFAEGSKTVAGGIGSHAEGANTQALGDGSHAEGANTQALGTKSHAEGNACVAQGDYAHAEGNVTVAYGDSSHAEGLTGSLQPHVTRAYTAQNVVIYIDTPIPSGCVIYDTDDSLRRVQSCQYQENEGDYKVLFVGINQDLAVDSTIYVDYCAYGEGSHIEGSHTHAAGDYSHAEGYYTMTTNASEHASGKYNKSTYSVTLFSVGIGTADNARANAFEIDANGKVYVKGVGGYDGTNIGGQDVKALGDSGWVTVNYADITGAPIRVSEQGGYALGEYSIATASDAFAEGASVAFGAYSHSEGAGSITFNMGAHAEGASVAFGKTAHSEGYYTYAFNNSAHSEGRRTYAYGIVSHAEGNNTWASGVAAHAEGQSFGGDSMVVPARRFHLIIYNDRIEYEAEEGISIYDLLNRDAVVLSDNSTEASPEMPIKVMFYNPASHAVQLFEHSIYMTGDYALLQNYKSAEGTTITCAIVESGAQGTISHTEGLITRALGDMTHAEGTKTKAIGESSHTEGFNDIESFDLIVSEDTPISDGVIPIESTLPFVEAEDILNSRETKALVSAAILDNNIYVCFHHILATLGLVYDNGTISGIELDQVTGLDGTVKAGSRITIYYSGAVGDFSHAEGYNTSALGQGSHAEGMYTETTNPAEHAEGTYNLSTHNVTLSSLGIGSGSGQTPRINAYEVDLQGNVYIKGIGGYDGTNITGTGVKSVQTVIAELAQQITTLQGGGNNS